MNWVADENVDRHIVKALRLAGQTVAYVPDESPGITDVQLLERVTAEGAILITADKDFGEMFSRRAVGAAGLLLLRLAGLSPDERASLVVQVVRQEGVRLRGTLTVVTPRAIRIRRSPR